MTILLVAATLASAAAFAFIILGIGRAERLNEAVGREGTATISGLLCFCLLVTTLLHVWSVDNEEIDLESYGEVWRMVREDPTAHRTVRKAMQDGRISRSELDTIQDHEPEESQIDDVKRAIARETGAGDPLKNDPPQEP